MARLLTPWWELGRCGAAVGGGREAEEGDAVQGIGNNVSVVGSRMFTNSFVSFNPTGDGKLFFSALNVRLALTQAVDRQRIVTEVLAGKGDPDPSPLPGGGSAFSGAAPPPHPQHPRRAGPAPEQD